MLHHPWHYALEPGAKFQGTRRARRWELVAQSTPLFFRDTLSWAWEVY